MAGDWLSQDQLSAASDRSYAPQPAFRDQLDALRSMWGTPQSQYPDGYGILPEERRRRISQPASQFDRNTFLRGVAKGGQIDPALYIWPADFNLMTGIELEAQGKKFAPTGEYVYAPGARTNIRGPQVVDEQATATLSYMRPSWQ